MLQGFERRSDGRAPMNVQMRINTRQKAPPQSARYYLFCFSRDLKHYRAPEKGFKMLHPSMPISATAKKQKIGHVQKSDDFSRPLETIRQSDHIKRVPSKAYSNLIRYISFNVNGVKTLFNYNPWNYSGADLSTVLQLLSGDIVSLQELKLSPLTLSSAVRNIGHLRGYRSFISLPRERKGYSGVGLFIRDPDILDPIQTRLHLTVVNAEEGVSGYLLPGIKKAPDSICYRQRPSNIGGYDSNMTESQGLDLDSEGRCVVVELASHLVVFSVYCPANSMASSDGEQRRVDFLQALFTRARNLRRERGIHVLIMGDINVCLDLIDSAEYMSDYRDKKLTMNYSGKDGIKYEDINHEHCVSFQSSLQPRSILNAEVYTGMKQELNIERSQTLSSPLQYLYDTIRYWCGRQMQLYSVWNTITSARAVNYGSRIDLILTSDPTLVQTISSAGHFTHILGLDHCPVYTDFDVVNQIGSAPDGMSNHIDITMAVKLPFEAKHHFKLLPLRDISEMMKSRTTLSKPTTTDIEAFEAMNAKRKQLSLTREHTSRKPPQKMRRSIDTFFRAPTQ